MTDGGAEAYLNTGKPAAEHTGERKNKVLRGRPILAGVLVPGS